MSRRDYGALPAALGVGKYLTEGLLRSHNGRHERPFRNLRHLPEDYSLAYRGLRPSFLKIRDQKDARPAGRRRFIGLAMKGRGEERKPTDGAQWN
jgi:hypothetical protein